MPPSIVSASPTVLIEGAPSSFLTSSLRSLEVEEDEFSGRLARLEVDNTPIRSGRQVVFPAIVNAHRIGTVVAIQDGGETLFEGRIVGHRMEYLADQPPIFELHLADQLALLGRETIARGFTEISLADLIQNVASEVGLAAECDGGDFILPQFDQGAQSTGACISALLERFGYYWLLDGNTLRVAPRAQLVGSPKVLVYGNSLHALEVVVDGFEIPTEARSTHWHAATAQRSELHLARSWIAQQVAAGKAGPDVVHSALGESTRWVDTANAPHPALAQAHTEAAFHRAASEFVQVFGEAIPLPQIRVGAGVDLRGIDEWSAGVYRLREVFHRFDRDRGLRSEFVGERASIGYSAVKRSPRGRSRSFFRRAHSHPLPRR